MPIPGNERRRRFNRRRTVGLLCAAVGLALCAPAQSPPPTLVSGSPALTDLVLRLGLGARLLGITRWCQLPPGESRPLIGDALSLDFETIARLQPAWLVTQNSDPGQLRALAAISPRTRRVVFTIESLADIAAAARRLADILDAPEAGLAAAARFEAELAVLKANPRPAPPRMLFLIGTDRPLVAGPETFTGELIEVAGGRNAARDLVGLTRWRQATLEEILAARPDWLICQCEVGDEAAARAYWSRWQAAGGFQLVVTADPEWTRPTLALPAYAARLRQWIETPPAEDDHGF